MTDALDQDTRETLWVTGMYEPFRFRQDELDALPDRLVGPVGAAKIARCTSLRQFKLLLAAGIFDLGERPWAPLSVWIAADKALVRPDNAGHTQIYFIESRGFIKIGYSTSAIFRLSVLQASTPHKLQLLGAVEGSPQDEARLHHIFRESRETGEWFKKTPPLLAYIDWLLAQK